MRNKKKLPPGRILVITGLLLLAAALLLTGYNLWDEGRAEEKADAALEGLLPEIEEESQQLAKAAEAAAAEQLEVIPDYMLNPEMDMPVKEIDGIRYIGALDIPVLGLSLPVIDAWSYPNLKIAPCRYTGSAYLNDLVIAAHNYRSHFRNIKSLRPGDALTFTDVDGNAFPYEVQEIEVLAPTAIEKMVDSPYDLTLFTCTYGGQSRLAVRCVRSETE